MAVRAAAHGGPRHTQRISNNDFAFPPTHKPPVRAGHPAGPPNEFPVHYVLRTRRGRRPRRPVPVNHRAVNQRWTGRPGGRPLRKRKNEPLRNSMVPRAAKRGGPYKVVRWFFRKSSGVLHWGPHRAVARWGKEERTVRLSVPAARGREVKPVPRRRRRPLLRFCKIFRINILLPRDGGGFLR